MRTMGAVLIAAILAFLPGAGPAVFAESSMSSSDNPQIFLDYRDAGFREAFPTYDHEVLDHVIPEFIGPDLHGPQIFGVFDLSPDTIQDFIAELFVRGDAEGAFLERDRRQHVYLLSYGQPIAAGPPPERYTQALVVIEDSKLVDAVPLPIGSNYQRLVGILDVTGDGKHELLLESAHFHMGQLLLTADVVAVGANGGEVLSHLGVVYEDSCGAPMTSQTIKAKVLATQPRPGGGALSVQHWYARCREGHEPSRDEFVRANSNGR